MMILGITGCPGSGKSMLTDVLVQREWILIDADELGREVVEFNPDVLDELKRTFGSDIINTEGRLDRRLLAVRAFAKPEKTKLLNNIVHPRLIRRLKERIENERERKTNSVVDCALIFEWGIEKLFDMVVCVSADESLRKKRLMDRDTRSLSEIEDLFAAQLSECEKMRKADIVIKNNNSVEKLKMFGMLLSGIPRYYSDLF